MQVNRKDICVAVTTEGKMLVGQGTGIQSMLRKYEGKIAAKESVYFSQLRYRSIQKVNGEWRICKGKEGIGVSFAPPPRTLHGGMYLEFDPQTS